MIEARAAHQGFPRPQEGRDQGRGRRFLPGGARDHLRAPGRERRRKDHDAAAAGHPPEADERDRGRRRPRRCPRARTRSAPTSGFLATSTALYARLTAREMIEYFGRLNGLGGAALRRTHPVARRRARHARLPRPALRQAFDRDEAEDLDRPDAHPRPAGDDLRRADARARRHGGPLDRPVRARMPRAGQDGRLLDPCDERGREALRRRSASSMAARSGPRARSPSCAQGPGRRTWRNASSRSSRRRNRP